MIDEDRYYDAKQSEHESTAKVPFGDYRDLEEKYEQLENEFEEFKTDVLHYGANGDVVGLIEYLKSKEVF